MNKRCGECENCKKLEQVKTSVLRCCGTPKTRPTYGPRKTSQLTAEDFNHADDGVVAVWNQSLKDYPCTKEK